MTEIRTNRLLLRRARESDLEEMHAILSNPVAMEYWSTPPHHSIETTRNWLTSMIAAPVALSEDFVIERDGRLIGKVGAHRLPDFGFILHPEQWGQGMASEAARAFIDAAFARGDINHLTADVDPRNAASLNVIRKLGFRETGRANRTYRTHIGWCGSIFFRLDRPLRRQG